MKNRKKLFTVLAAMAISLSLLAGCDTPAQNSPTASPSSQASAAAANVSASITEEEAKQIALNHAGIAEENTSFLYVKQDVDDGKAEYDVEFWADGKEYDYEVDASTGKILSVDYDAEHYSPSSQSQQSTGTNVDGAIDETKAKEIALNHAGLTEADVSFVHVKMDYDDGRTKYDVEFYQGNTEYDYEIDATTGDILSYDHDAEHYSPPSGNTDGNYIGEAEAKSIALNHAGLSEGQVSRFSIQLDRDDGRAEYEVEFHVGRTEYNYEINASNGYIISYEKDND